MSDPIALVKQSVPRDVLVGLFRAAEFKEQSEGAPLWDDTCRRALDWMRSNVAEHAATMPDDVVVAYACGQCGTVAHDERGAREHCEPATCSRCGGACLPAWTICKDCRRKDADEDLRKKFDAAEKLEWSAHFDEPVYDPHGHGSGEGYFADLESLRDYYLNEPTLARPAWAWATFKFGAMRPDADEIIEQMTQEMHENASDDFDASTLQTILDAWFAEQTCVSYGEDDKRAIVLDAAFWEE